MTTPTAPTDAQTIEALKTTYKKRGHFDTLRKDLFARFCDSDAKATLLSSVTRTLDRETSRDPSILARDQSSAARILESVVEHTHAYQDVEKVLDELLAEKRAEIESMIRAIMVAQGLSKVSGSDKKREREEEEEGKVNGVENEKEKKEEGKARVSRWDIGPREEEDEDMMKEKEKEGELGRVEITPEVKVNGYSESQPMEH